MRKIDLNECEEIIRNHIYYIRKPIKLRYSHYDGTFGYSTDEYEFLLIANKKIKEGIILRCGYKDLHWFIPKKLRKQHILSDALKTGVVKEIWPENKTISFCYRWDDDCSFQEKYTMTKHLADIAGLKLLK